MYVYILLTLSVLFSSENYIWPVNTKEALTTVFGDIRPFRYHTGMDVRTFGINGLDVYAIQDGYVSRIAISTSGYGKVIYIKMIDGNTSVYAHLDGFSDKIKLLSESLQNDCQCYSIDKTFSPGQIIVKQGDVIGYTGDTGSLSGPHLHFEVRNKNGRPFNPLLSNYSVKDDISPIPKKISIHNLSKDTKINGRNYKEEFELTKISNQEYLYDGIISVQGEFGISLEVYDKMNGQPFNFGIYSISLEMDERIIYEAQYDNIGFEEGEKVFLERNFHEYTNKRGKVYELFKKNEKASSFIKTIPDKKLILNDNSYHQCKITVWDYNNNKAEVSFIMVSQSIPEYKPILKYFSDGILIKSYENEIKNIEMTLTNSKDNGLQLAPDIDSLSHNNYFIKKPNPGYNIIKSTPTYNSGVKGPSSYNLIIPKRESIEGKINLIDSNTGTTIQFIENDFTGMSPTLGLTINGKLFRKDMLRTSKNVLSSELFYPSELKDLTNISVLYIDSTEYQFELDIISDVSTDGLPFILNSKKIKLESYETPNNTSIANEILMYYIPSTNSNIESDINYIHGPFIVGPSSIPFNYKIILSYTDDSIKDNYGIYKYDTYNKKWKFSDNIPNDKSIQTIIRSGGIFCVSKDIAAPQVSQMVPSINSTYRANQFNKIKFRVEDDLSGIDNENNIQVFLNRKKLIVEYNSYRNMVFYEMKGYLNPGSHEIEVIVTDNSGNSTRKKGSFSLK